MSRIKNWFNKQREIREAGFGVDVSPAFQPADPPRVDYEKLINDIRKEFPLSSPAGIHIENPMDCAFVIELLTPDIETKTSRETNLQLVENYRARRAIKYKIKQRQLIVVNTASQPVEHSGIIDHMKDAVYKTNETMVKIKNQAAKAESKHYTPTIEEFHVGFEYEIRHADHGDWGPWIKRDTNDPHQIYQRKSEIDGNSKNVQVRVKWLDQADIESFGFKTGSGDHDYEQVNGKFQFEILHGAFGRGPVIVKLTDDYGEILVHYEEIKNKSQLRRILKKVGAI